MQNITGKNNAIPDESELMVINLRFPFEQFLNQTDTMYADDLKIASLYAYDWDDQNGDEIITYDELVLVNRGGSWGTVQEIRITDPKEKFSHVPVIGVYPVPDRYSFWAGKTNQNSTAIDYDLVLNHYKKDRWNQVTISDDAVTILPNDSANVTATISVPQSGTSQGFITFEGTHHTVNAPVSYISPQKVIGNDLVVITGQNGTALYGDRYVRGAFDMSNRYMAGDWQQYYFDVDDASINSMSLELSWQNPDSSFSMFVSDPDGKIIQSNVPSGVFGYFLGWPSSDWLGVTPFSQGGGFFPVKNKDDTSSVIFAPINQTGTYSLLVHSTLFDADDISQPISIAAKFSTILPDELPPRIIFVNNTVINPNYVTPKIIEEYPDSNKFILDGQEITPDDFEVIDDGKHLLRIISSDTVGHVTEKSFSFVTDTTLPEIDVIAPVNGTIISDQLFIDVFVLDKNKPKDALTITLPDFSQIHSESYSYDTTNLLDGTYRIVLSAMDLAKNNSTQTVFFIVDHNATKTISQIPKSYESPVRDENQIQTQPSEIYGKSYPNFSFSDELMQFILIIAVIGIMIAIILYKKL